jgi:signal transduction histidine kinase
LYVVRGKDQGKRFDLDVDRVTLGRDRSSWIQLRDNEISRHHAEIIRDAQQFSIRDLNSSNGTFVNGVRTSLKLLASGDRVQIGGSVLIFTSSRVSPPRDLTKLIDITQGPKSQTNIVSSVETDAPSDQNDGDSSWSDRTRRNLNIMYQTALAASHTLDINQLLDRIMSMILDSISADRGCVMLIDPETEKLVPRLSARRDSQSPAELLQISQTILDFVMTNRRGVLTSDAGKDSRWDPAVSILKMGVREAICVPMQGRYGIVGVIYIDTFIPPGQVVENQGKPKFNDEHLKLMIGIAHQAALAVEDTTYYSAMISTERLAAMGQTIAMLSHHIKNILQGIQGGSYLIEEGLKNGETEIVSKGWAMVDKNQQRISHLVMDMLSFSKDREPELGMHNLNEVVADVIELLNSRADEAGIRLNWEPDETIPEVSCDAEALHRAILNVGSNAIDACPKNENAAVTVSVAYNAETHQVSINVEDTGTGIEAENLEKIFSIFESGKGNRGTGLGLAVSRKIMREHGGDVKVSSILGKGSLFSLWLPVRCSETTAVEHGAADRLAK